MPSFIQPNCTSCADCESVCPTFSIFRGRNQFVVDTDTCEECGFCAMACKVNAITLAPRVPPKPEEAAKAEAKTESPKS